MFEKRLAEIKEDKVKINARKLEIRSELSKEGVDLEAMKTELEGLETQEAELVVEETKEEEKRSIAARINAGTMEVRKISKPGEAKNMEKEVLVEAEKRGQDLKEKRAVTIASNVVLAAHKATDIKPTFNEVSSLIDRVTVKPLIGGESYEQPYLVNVGEGDYTAEGVAYDTAEPVFGKVTIGKAKITAYAEESEEVMKLGAADYDSVIVDGISKGTRKKITKEILVGTGAANHLAGIFTVAATAIDAATDIEVDDIDETTLDEIIYSFGGDEDVEDTSVLILNKKDLKAFAILRDADGKKIYNVKAKGNTGTIDEVPFLINSACKAVSDIATVAGNYAMAYGPLSNYTMTIFSQLEVQRSTDFKFSTGMVAHKGVIFAGGNVTASNGFLRVKKA